MKLVVFIVFITLPHLKHLHPYTLQVQLPQSLPLGCVSHAPHHHGKFPLDPFQCLSVHLPASLPCFTRKKYPFIGWQCFSRESCFSGCKFGWLVSWFMLSKSRHLRKRVTHSYIHQAWPWFQYQFLVEVFTFLSTYSNWVTGHEFGREKTLWIHQERNFVKLYKISTCCKFWHN